MFCLCFRIRKRSNIFWQVHFGRSIGFEAGVFFQYSSLIKSDIYIRSKKIKAIVLAGGFGASLSDKGALPRLSAVFVIHGLGQKQNDYFSRCSKSELFFSASLWLFVCVSTCE